MQYGEGCRDFYYNNMRDMGLGDGIVMAIIVKVLNQVLNCTTVHLQSIVFQVIFVSQAHYNNGGGLLV